MASEHSFDVVSKIDFQEFDNALNQARKELSQRYDLKDSNTSIEYNQKELTLTILSANEFTLKSAIDIFHSKLIKRNISIKLVEYGKVESATHQTIRQHAKLKEGIDKENAKIINTLIKNMNIKAQSSIQGDTVRVTSKDIDVLQNIQQQLAKAATINIPLQYVNYR